MGFCPKIRVMKIFVFLIKLLLVLAMLAFIWGQSLLPGELSESESEWVLTLVYPVVEILQRGLAHFGRVYELSFLVRKLAHFTEYAVLGMLMYILFLKPDGRSRYILPMGLCLAAAGIDEGIQIFAADRGPALRDVILDFAGSCAGIYITAFVVVILYMKSRRRRAR